MQGRISPELLRGFLAEAQGYVNSLREALASSDGALDRETLQEMSRQMHILCGSAEVLGLTGVAELAAPAEETLNTALETGADLSEGTCQMLADVVDQIEAHLKALAGPDYQDRLSAPDLPAGLLEVFVLEAQEHCQAILVGLEQARRHPGDPTPLSEVRRITHTLKGAAASVGFSNLAHLAHLMEGLLEHHLEIGDPLPTETSELLTDTADVLEDLLGPDQGTATDRLLQSIDKRFAELLGEAYTPMETPQALVPRPEDLESARALRAESLLRLPLASVDWLINRIGETIINQATLEGYLDELRELASELDHATRRLRRVASDTDVQIETISLTGVGDSKRYDSSFDPLELERFPLLHQHALELAEISTDINDISGKLHILRGDLDAALTHERRLTSDLQEHLVATRLVPFREIETRLRRTVHRTAHDLGKSVDMILTGLDTEVDKTVLDTLVDPLMHLLRNAVDHGIEPPQMRRAAGKPSTGLVTLSVLREHGRVVLRLSDDGEGIDLNQIHKRAVDMGLLTESDQPTSEQLIDLLFEEGFSLAKIVTQTSGRGIGLNIVGRAVSQLRGTVRVETSVGHGTIFIISVPVTMAIIRALFVQSCGQTFAIPLEQIVTILRLDEGALEEIRTHDALRHGDDRLPVYNLAAFVREPGMANLEAQHYGLLVSSDAQNVIVLVESLAGTGEAVVKSLGTHLRRVFGIQGATISGDGRVLLILNLPEIVGAGPVVADDLDRPDEIVQTPSATGRRVLVVDDSPSVRRVVCSFLERAGWQATAARDGVEALEKIASARPDVALVDIEMPRMNGFELLSVIRSDPDLQNIPVVFLTSRSAAKHRDRAEQLQVDGYLVKPYREEELLEVLSRAAQKVM